MRIAYKNLFEKNTAASTFYPDYFHLILNNLNLMTKIDFYLSSYVLFFKGKEKICIKNIHPNPSIPFVSSKRPCYVPCLVYWV